MNVYVSRERALKMADLLAQARRLRGYKVECRQHRKCNPDRSVEIGWTAKVVCDRVRLFA